MNKVPIGGMVNNPQGNANDFRPLRQYQGLNVLSHDFYSNYNSLQTTLTKQTGIMNYTLAYTWSKAMGIGGILDGFNLRSNYAPLNFDRTHVFSASYVVNLPNFIRGGSAFARGAVNGWQISGIVQAYSGPNLQQNAGSGNFDMRAQAGGLNINGAAIMGTPEVRAQPIITCDPRSGLGTNQFINGSCFAPPIPIQNGRIGTNGSFVFPYLRGPAFFNADLSVFKNFQISEVKSLQFRVSAYNFPNHPVRSFIGGDPNLVLNFDNQGRLANDRFGFADNKVGRRNIQLAVKFYF